MERNTKRFKVNNNRITECKKYESIFKKELEWISYKRFCDIKYIAEGRLGNTYRANMIEEYIFQMCSRSSGTKKNRMKSVLLKSLDDPNNVTSKSVNEVF
jgi:hypothetical protein